MSDIENEPIFMNADAKRRLMSAVGALPEGKVYDVTIKQQRAKRTSPQNRFYWGFIVRPFARYMMSHNAELTLKAAMDAANLRLKQESLDEIPLVDGNGEVIGSFLPSEASLDKAKMSELIDKSVAFVTRYDIQVISPEEYFASLEREKSKRKKRAA